MFWNKVWFHILILGHRIQKIPDGRSTARMCSCGMLWRP